MSGKALVALGGQGIAEVDVYRDGNMVTVVGQGSFVKDTPYGKVKVAGVMTTQFETIEAFEYAQRRTFEIAAAKGQLGAYFAIRNKLMRLGFTDDARQAPPLPAHLRQSPMMLGQGNGR